MFTKNNNDQIHRISKPFLVFLCFALMLTGCSVMKEPEIYGVWVGKVDMSSGIEETLNSSSFDKFLPYMEPEGLEFEVEFTFKEDGTYSFSAQEDSVRTLAENLKASFKNAIEEYFEVQRKDKDSDLNESSSESFLDQVLNSAFSEENFVSQFLEKTQAQGRFLIEKEKLYLSVGLEEEINKDIYEIYSLSSTELVFVQSIGCDAKDEDSRLGEFYPLTLIRK